MYLLLAALGDYGPCFLHFEAEDVDKVFNTAQEAE